jgi:hypothetical protein
LKSSARSVSVAAIRSNASGLKLARIWSELSILHSSIRLSRKSDFQIQSVSSAAIHIDHKLLKSISIHCYSPNFRVRYGMLEEVSGRALILFLGSAISVVIGRSVEMINISRNTAHVEAKVEKAA